MRRFTVVDVMTLIALNELELTLAASQRAAEVRRETITALGRPLSLDEFSKAVAKDPTISAGLAEKIIMFGKVNSDLGCYVVSQDADHYLKGQVVMILDIKLPQKVVVVNTLSNVLANRLLPTPMLFKDVANHSSSE